MNRKILKAALIFLSSVLTIFFCFSFVISSLSKNFALYDDAAELAMMLSFSNGSISPPEDMSETTEETPDPSKKTVPQAPTEKATETKKTVHSGTAYPVVEKSEWTSNLSFENIEIENTTDHTVDAEKILKSDLPFEIEDNRRVQVLIYHTHTCESYLSEDSGVYYDDFYPRSTDARQSVCAVGEAIVKELKSRGIGAVHDTTLHDYPSYDGSYDRSYATVQSYLEKYPQIKVTIDIHRDAMTASDNTKYKPTCIYNDKKAAQIMIMTGRDTDSSDFPFWEENLIFALKLQKKCEDMYEGFTRPLYFGDFTYNMNVNNGSLLIEVGTDGNTLDEAIRSGQMLGNALAAVLQNP